MSAGSSRLTRVEVMTSGHLAVRVSMDSAGALVVRRLVDGRGRHAMPARVYRVVVNGEMGPAMREAFSDLETRAEHGRTVLSGELADQAALYSVLARLQALGLELVGLSVDGDDR